MLRALIIDDEAPARIELRAQLEQFPVEIVGEATSAREAAQLIAAIDYDVIFLDIQMPGLSGLDLARQLASRPRPPRVVFTTAYPQYAAGAFGVGATDYLVKPFDEERLGRALQRVLAQMPAAAAPPPPAPAVPAPAGAPVPPAAGPVAAARAPERAGAAPARTPIRLPVDRGGKTLLLDPAEIVFAFALDEQVYLKLAREKLRCNFTMRELEERLAPCGFVRTHRRYLVNIGRVREVIRYFKGSLGLIVDDAERSEVPVSRSLAPEVRPRLGL